LNYYELDDDAAAWLADPSEEPFSFRWVCLHLSLNPDEVRRRYAGKEVE
jgi:hypothetical protein